MRNYITYRIRTWKNRITVTTDKLECWTGNMCNQKFMNSHVNSLFGVLDEKKRILYGYSMSVRLSVCDQISAGVSSS
jgi:hypothetical protein